MAAETMPRPDTRPAPAVRAIAALFIAGGLLMAVGGQLHPQGSGTTVDAHLLSMFEAPAWPLAHAILLAGSIAAALAFVVAWRTQAFGPRIQALLPWVIVGWGFGALELIPHLLAAHEAHELAHHHATPVLDVHLVMQVVAAPAVGLTGAAIAVAVARTARSRVAGVLAAVAVTGGVVSAAAAPLVVFTGDPRYTVLFPFQAGLAIWLIGTGVRLAANRSVRLL